MARRVSTCATVAALALCAAGCSRQDARIQQHRKSFESLGATTAAISDAWLAGQVSGTYTSAALETTFDLIEQERAALAGAPQALQDPRGADLSQAAERLSRIVAAIMLDVAEADGKSVRRRVAQMPITPAGRR